MLNEDNYQAEFLYISIKEKMNSPFKMKLIYTRRFFYNYPFLYTFFKFIVGLILFTVPIFLFFVFLKHEIDTGSLEFSKSIIYILISCFLMIFYLIFLFVYKIMQIFDENV